jgi:hypothetical protein
MKHAAGAIDYELRIASLEAAVLDLLAMHKALQRANDMLKSDAFLEAQKAEARARTGARCPSLSTTSLPSTVISRTPRWGWRSRSLSALGRRQGEAFR